MLLRLKLSLDSGPCCGNNETPHRESKKSQQQGKNNQTSRDGANMTTATLLSLPSPPRPYHTIPYHYYRLKEAYRRTILLICTILLLVVL
mmetsp:Transcript_18296/g.34960  ORF Transcript_18296/g.34960 Transcript_18296/m.34960 type:complete len:90 (+) Transcript_18296:1575-1844(+)